jgi:hypothetical protein
LRVAFLRRFVDVCSVGSAIVFFLAFSALCDFATTLASLAAAAASRASTMDLGSRMSAFFASCFLDLRHLLGLPLIFRPISIQSNHFNFKEITNDLQDQVCSVHSFARTRIRLAFRIDLSRLQVIILYTYRYIHFMSFT